MNWVVRGTSVKWVVRGTSVNWVVRGTSMKRCGRISRRKSRYVLRNKFCPQYHFVYCRPHMYGSGNKPAWQRVRFVVVVDCV